LDKPFDIELLKEKTDMVITYGQSGDKCFDNINVLIHERHVSGIVRLLSLSQILELSIICFTNE
jgi:hypothetical protein